MILLVATFIYPDKWAVSSFPPPFPYVIPVLIVSFVQMEKVTEFVCKHHIRMMIAQSPEHAGSRSLMSTNYQRHVSIFERLSRILTNDTIQPFAQIGCNIYWYPEELAYRHTTPGYFQE